MRFSICIYIRSNKGKLSAGALGAKSSREGNSDPVQPLILHLENWGSASEVPDWVSGWLHHWYDFDKKRLGRGSGVKCRRWSRGTLFSCVCFSGETLLVAYLDPIPPWRPTNRPGHGSGAIPPSQDLLRVRTNRAYPQLQVWALINLRLYCKLII